MENGARLRVTSFSDNLIAVKFVTGTFKDKIKLQLTINKAQGQLLKKLAFIYQLLFKYGNILS